MITIEAGLNNCTLINVSTKHDKKILINLLDSYKNQYYKYLLIVVNTIDQHYYDHIIKNLNIHKIIYITNITPRNPSYLYYSSIDTFIRDQEYNFNNEVIIILNDDNKKITRHLQKQTHESRLLINLNNIQHNIDYFKTKLKPNTKIMAMVKASGYGLDNNSTISRLLQAINIDYLGVTYIDEGIELRNNGITTPIMLLVTNTHYLSAIKQYNLEPTIYSFKVLDAVIKDAKPTNKYYVHIKIDTGMHRLGFLPEQVNDLISALKTNPNIIIKSVFSHLSASDELTTESETFSKNQISILTNIAKGIQQSLGYTFITHIANTEAISKYTGAHLDMVRIGKGLYGLYSYNNDTKPIATLQTTIAQIKNIKKNETIGYNRKKTLDYDTKIAIIKIGYADGYSYDITQNAYVIINNKKAYILGKVCMDLCMIDVTDIDCKEGDTVTLFNEQELPVEQLANWKNTSAYEVITSISPRIKRIYTYKS